MPILTKRANKTPLGIYVHVPFCSSFHQMIRSFYIDL